MDRTHPIDRGDRGITRTHANTGSARPAPDRLDTAEA